MSALELLLAAVALFALLVLLVAIRALGAAHIALSQIKTIRKMGSMRKELDELQEHVGVHLTMQAESIAALEGEVRRLKRGGPPVLQSDHEKLRYWP